MSIVPIPCPEGKIYNPLTRHCIDSSKKAGLLINLVHEDVKAGINLRDCPETYIRTPPIYLNKRRCIPDWNYPGTLIKAVLEQKLPTGYVYNPNSASYVKAGGKSGEQLLGKWSCQRYPPRDPNYQFHPTKVQSDIAQYFVDTIRPGSPENGLLLYWSLGAGKTCAAILILDKYLKQYPQYKKVYVLTSGSLRDNFLDQYCTICGENPERTTKMFEFITYNYSGIIHKLPSPEEMDGSIIVIDEVHNIIRGYINESANAMAVYNLLASLTESKFILLSGTPVTRWREELYYLLQLLLPGYYETLDIFLQNFEKKNDEGEIVPDNQEGYFIPNEDVVEVISNVVSRVAVATSLAYYPLTNTQFITVPMTEEQSRREENMEAEEDEHMHPPDEALRQRDPVKYNIEKRMYILAVQRLKSRQAGNMIYPSYILKEDDPDYSKKEDKLVEDGGWINDQIIEHLEDYSPKFKVILNLVFFIKGKHVIYSEFKTRYGVHFLAAVLKYYNVPTLLYTGDLNDEQRNDVTRKFNDPENAMGKNYKVLLITEAGGEGTNFLAAHALHIVEQNIDEFSIRQVEGRVVRYSSHFDLPIPERYVIIFRYFSILPGENISFEESIETGRYAADYRCYARGMERVREITPTIDLLAGLPTIPTPAPQ